MLAVFLVSSFDIMQRSRRWIAWGAVLLALGAAAIVARQGLIKAYRGTEPIGIDSRPAAATFQRAFPFLRFERPIGLTFPPDGSRRIVVIGQFGKIFIFRDEPSVPEAAELIDLSDRVCQGGSNEEGLLGLAFHPRFEQNRQFFVFYTDPEHCQNVARYEISVDDPNRADPQSGKVILTTPQGTGNHNGGTLLFGPDGYLYVAIGDGGPIGDPHGRGQDLSTVLGKVLRIDVDRQDPGLGYAIPADNPFVGRPGARGEIWALGLRNVWRMAFDRVSGRLWAGDVGNDAWEEIDLIERGGNYGWNLNEGFGRFRSNRSVPVEPREGIVGTPIDPVFAYHHAVGNCVIGGCVYRGQTVPALSGAYLFADHVVGQLYALRYDGTSGRAKSVARILPLAMPVFSFGENESGDVFFTTTEGTLHRLVAAGD
jgi:quinoprotein glucose dehydrogenase